MGFIITGLFACAMLYTMYIIYKIIVYKVLGGTVNGKIVRAEKSRFVRRRGSGNYGLYEECFYIIFQYEVNGKIYESKTKRIFESREFKNGDTITVNYLMNNPEKAVYSRFKEFISDMEIVIIIQITIMYVMYMLPYIIS